MNTMLCSTRRASKLAEEVFYRKINIYNEAGSLCTHGLKPFLNHELKINTQGKSNDDYLRVIRYLIDYVVDCKPLIKHEQTITYHSWILKFIEISRSLYEIWEASACGEGYIRGVDHSIKVINDQELVCGQHGAVPVFPAFSQLVVLSKGVYEGLNVEAVRYPSPGHMSGWWITTHLYGGDTDSLITDHYYHLAFRRPDLLKFLALPFGYRLNINGSENEAWFDQKAVE